MYAPVNVIDFSIGSINCVRHFQNLNFQHRGFVDIGESVDHRCLSVLSIIILFTNYALCLLFYKKRERVNKERKYATEAQKKLRY
jgi:hypothetical protein